MAAIPRTGRASELSETDESFFAENGYLVFEDLIDSRTAGEILKEAVKVARGDRWHPDWNPSGLDGLQQLGHFSRMLDEATFATLLSRAHAIAERLLGRETVLWADQLIMKPGGCAVEVAWHQDAAYWCNWGPVPNLPSGSSLADSDRAVTCWVALCDVTPDMAPVRYLAGSHKHRFSHRQVTVATDAYNKRDPFYLAPESLEFWLERTVQCPLRAGDCTFHESGTVHGSGPNISAESRYGLALHFWPVTGWDVEGWRRSSERYLHPMSPASIAE